MTADRAKNAPLVSVVLPFYNAPFLKAAVESVLAQHYSDFELLLIDNGSTDASTQIANSFSKHARVTLIKEPRRGVVHAANAGIAASQGSFIARMDADDICYPDRLLKQVDFLQKNPDVGVVSGHIDYLGHAEKNEGFVRYIKWLNAIKSGQEIALNRFIELPVVNPSLMFRKEVFENHGLFQEGGFPEDYELFLRVLESGVKFGKVSKPILQWRDSPDRLTRTDARYTTNAFFEVKSKYLAAWLEKNNLFHPEIWVWGAGRVSRRRSDLLKLHGVEISKYIDFKEAENTVHYQNIPAPGNCFIVSYVANRGAREEIRHFLTERGYKEGFQFILAS